MIRVLSRLLRFAFKLYARVVLIGAGVSVCIAAWAYYGYRHIGCHPMFSSANIQCGSVQTLAAKHSLEIVRTLAPYQQTLRDNQTALMIWAGVVFGAAVAVELAFGILAIRHRRRTRRDMFEGTMDS